MVGYGIKVTLIMLLLNAQLCYGACSTDKQFLFEIYKTIAKDIRATASALEADGEFVIYAQKPFEYFDQDVNGEESLKVTESLRIGFMWGTDLFDRQIAKYWILEEMSCEKNRIKVAIRLAGATISENNRLNAVLKSEGTEVVLAKIKWS